MSEPFFSAPGPAVASTISRVTNLLLLLITLTWVLRYLGGLAVSPTPVPGKADTNNTGPIFNWHPLCMVLAFPVLMGEALLSFRQPANPSAARPVRKTVHWVLHTSAIVLIYFGALAAYKSHSLKKPDPIPNFYSVHSYLGLTVIILATLQYAAGLISFLKPKLSLPARRAMMPVHVYFGRTVFVLGLATMALGLQEKATFLQFGAAAPVYGGMMVLPAVLGLLLAFTGGLVMYVHASDADSKGPPGPAFTLVSEDEEQLVGHAA